MAQESIDLINGAYEAWHRSGLDAFVGFCAEDVRWRSIEGAPDDRGPLQGRAAVRGYIQDWIETFDDFHVDVTELAALDDETVLAALRYGGRARHSGVDLPGTPFAAVFVVRDGQIVRCAEFETRQQAIESVQTPG